MSTGKEKIEARRQEQAKSAATGALWCTALLKAGLVALLLIKEGDFTMYPVTATFWTMFFIAGCVTHFLLVRSDPGFVTGDEEFGLMETGNGMSRDSAKKAGNVEEGVQMQEISLESIHTNGVNGDHGRPKDQGLEEITLAEPSPQNSARSSASIDARCTHCKTIQLLRTKHCYDCGRCVYTYDHHCFWIGNCVGEANRRLFWWYLATEFIMVAWACELVSTTFVYTNTKTWARDWFVWNAPSIAALGVTCCFALMIGAFLFFQTYLICTGQTSWEVYRRSSLSYLKGVPDRVFPFSEGWIRNILGVCWRPSKAPPRNWETPSPPWKESQRFWWIENEYWSCF